MGYYICKSYKEHLDTCRIFNALREYPYCFFLDSSLRHKETGRFSFLGCDPFLVLKTNNQDAFGKLGDLLRRYRLKNTVEDPPFIGGAVGYLAYDASFFLEEKLSRLRTQELKIPDCVFGFYNTIIAVDHFKGRVHIYASGFPERKKSRALLLARQNLKKLSGILARIEDAKYPAENDFPCARNAGLKSNFSRQGYLSAVKKAKEYIRRGDIYQVNLSQRFKARASLSAAGIYSRLRKESPAAFAAYFDALDLQILSSSPERFLVLKDDRVATRPMKGTRPRSPDQKKDAILRRELLNSVKDKAELTMIVDLERNDLGRVCSYGSVRPAQLRQLETYKTVYQTTATVEGLLHRTKDRIGLLRACFPGGSVTGAPKIRAMQIIEELEPHRRNIYTGSLGYLSFCGNMDFNILIRTILKKGNDLYFSAGGGIVADSSPLREYNETLVKARGMLDALGIDFSARSANYEIR